MHTYIQSDDDEEEEKFTPNADFEANIGKENEDEPVYARKRMSAVWGSGMYVRMYVRMHVCVNLYVCIYACMYVCMYVCKYCKSR
jgi:hypothetical protein